MDLPFAIGLFVAAVALTYFFCVRPMRRGQGHCSGTMPTSRAGGSSSVPGDGDHAARQRAEIALLREEIESLKASRR